MPKNEDGEFELVVGNKQLLSIVFILMVLFGVVFSMGYFVGRAGSNGDTAASAQAAAGAPLAGRPDAAGSRAAAPVQPASDTPLEPGEAKVETPSGTMPATSTVPAESTYPAPQTPAPSAEVSKPAAAPAKTPEAPKAEPAGAGPLPGQVFLQVAAVRKPQADLLVTVLRDKGFHAITAPVTVDGQEMFRTLVGPLKDASEVAKTKADLESAGFKPIVKRY